MITINVDDREVLAALDQLLTKTAHLKPLMQDIGEFLSETTKRRFDTSTAPDGSRWAPNSEVTILQYLGVYKEGSYKGTYNKAGKLIYTEKGKKKFINSRSKLLLTSGDDAGRLSKKGAKRAGSKRPLIGETRGLMSTINYRAENDSVVIGSPMIYAAVQQFGAKRREFGRAPWGDIPARPFLGISVDDRSSILDLISEYLDPES